MEELFRTTSQTITLVTVPGRSKKPADDDARLLIDHRRAAPSNATDLVEENALHPIMQLISNRLSRCSTARPVAAAS